MQLGNFHYMVSYLRRQLVSCWCFKQNVDVSFSERKFWHNVLEYNFLTLKTENKSAMCRHALVRNFHWKAMDLWYVAWLISATDIDAYCVCHIFFLFYLFSVSCICLYWIVTLYVLAFSKYANNFMVYGQLHFESPLLWSFFTSN